MTTSKKTSSKPLQAANKTATKSVTKSAKPARSASPSAPKVVSDYNGYDYKKIFWEDADRKYEDLADRLAIRKLLPEHMETFVDIAGGYGRLADEYLPRAASATLFDYSKTELAQAREIYGDRLQTKAGDIYSLPFKDNSFDALMMVRATHHFADMQKVSDQLFRILRPGGVAVIEVANKRTLPKMFRYWTKKSDINPFTLEPACLKDLNADGFYNYHPKYMEMIFRQSGFQIEKVLSVSNFRSAKLKRIFGTKNLVRLEKAAQGALAPIRFAPSIYYRLRKPTHAPAPKLPE